MTPEEVYALAVAAWGKAAGVWSPAPGRCIVGCWTPIGQFVGESVLRTDRLALQVRGEAATWEDAARAAGLIVFAEKLGTAAIVEAVGTATRGDGKPL